MAVNVKSKEFADAWRTVSEALLAYIQSGDLGNKTQTENNEDISPTQIEDVAPAEAERLGIREVRYAVCVIKQEDGSYIFKNLKDQKSDVSIYKITIYTDDSCEFELCDLQGEQKDYFKNNRDDSMPLEVGSMEGELTIDSVIITTKKGKGILEGRIVKVTEPLAAESRSNKITEPSVAESK